MKNRYSTKYVQHNTSHFDTVQPDKKIAIESLTKVYLISLSVSEKLPQHLIEWEGWHLGCYENKCF